MQSTGISVHVNENKLTQQKANTPTQQNDITISTTAYMMFIHNFLCIFPPNSQRKHIKTSLFFAFAFAFSLVHSGCWLDLDRKKRLSGVKIMDNSVRRNCFPDIKLSVAQLWMIIKDHLKTLFSHCVMCSAPCSYMQQCIWSLVRAPCLRLSHKKFHV